MTPFSNKPPAGDECPACGHPDMKTLCRGGDRLYGTTDRQFLVVECAQCRLIRLYPRPDPRDLQQYYPEDYWYAPGGDAADTLAESWRKFVLRDHVRFVRKAMDGLPENSKVLDVGCGGGLFLREMNLAPERAFGLDFSVNAAGVAWSTNGVPVACGALTSAPFRPGSFSLITMFHVLEHLYDPIAYVQAAHSLLAEGGRLVVQVPNAHSWQFLMFGESWNGLDIPRHLIDFKESDLLSLLEHCGFEVVRRKHFSLRDNPAGLATTLACGLDPMGRRIRGVKDSPRVKLWKDMAYFALVLAAIPFTLLEASCGAGATLMVEARRKP